MPSGRTVSAATISARRTGTCAGWADGAGLIAAGALKGNGTSRAGGKSGPRAARRPWPGAASAAAAFAAGPAPAGTSNARARGDDKPARPTGSAWLHDLPLTASALYHAGKFTLELISGPVKACFEETLISL